MKFCELVPVKRLSSGECLYLWGVVKDFHFFSLDIPVIVIYLYMDISCCQGHILTENCSVQTLASKKMSQKLRR